jgi:hypothetical protein
MFKEDARDFEFERLPSDLFFSEVINVSFWNQKHMMKTIPSIPLILL